MTNHKRPAMGNFERLLFDELEFLSKEADKYPVSTVVKNNHQQWGHAQLWIKGTKKFIQESTSATQKCFYAPSTSYLEGNANPSLQTLRDALWQCKKHEVFQDKRFDEYVLRTSQVYTLKPVQTPKNDQNFFTCTCPEYWKYATCKHSLGLSIWKGKVCVPKNYLVDSLEQLKKRGRPRKVKNFMEKGEK